MNTFIDFGAKTVKGGNIANLSTEYLYATAISHFFETDDAIYLDGIPCDKYTLSPITCYKDKIRTRMSGINFMTSPFTSTRYFNRSIGDANKFPYRMPYLPVNTLFKNNARLSNGDEVIITPSSNYIVGNKSTFIMVISKNTNKITWVNSTDISNFKSGIIALDDDKFITNRVGYRAASNRDAVGNEESILRYINRTNNTISNIALSSLGYIYNIIGRTTEGDLIILHSIQTGYPNMDNSAAILITFAISKLSKTDLTVTNLLTIPITPPSNLHARASDLHFEPALTLDNKTVYFVDGTVEGSNYRGAKYTIGKCEIDLDNGVATQVPITVDLNGLVDGLYHIPEVLNNLTKSTRNTNIILNYLEFGSKKYLIATNTSNASANINITATSANYAAYCFMYLFEINGDTLKLVDYKPGLGGSADIPQAVFPLNNAKNLLVIRQNGLDIVTVDTITSKFIVQDTISEPIYSCGIDELERIWYITSLDGLVNDAKLKVFSVGAVITVNTDFENPNLTYAGEDMDSNIIVSTRNNEGNRVITNLQLLLEGNAVFSDTNSKTINITTSQDVDMSVPIKIQGDGMISIYTNIVPS
ncbi:hypothetical protein [Clostridium tyrobutyricum]|uniref:hypothetical protein n=1 Tax=Clostridium tyrobutyricum TaxID=1519 RepID=UPI0010A9FF59|nr:hypothetical protein [Clostridium tyrobutyricum]QCH28448.1 hypothetical protein EZN00_02052 [Clostridium tyrobutyricum]